MVSEILFHPAVLAGTVGVGLLIVARFVDEEKAYETGKRHGILVTGKMRASKLGAKAWEKIEAFGQKVGGAYFHGIMDGLDTDDQEGADAEKTVPKA
jgi:hypothetical protein